MAHAPLRVGRHKAGAWLTAVLTLTIPIPGASASTIGELDGGALTTPWALPFAGLLLSIAVVPLLAPHFWHRHYGKVSAAWAAAFLAPFAVVLGPQVAWSELLHVLLLDYVPFISVLFALYTISGGVFVDGHLRATPLRNTGILAAGTLIASIAGTTGASVLLIRPLLRANTGRRYRVHVVVFFIFLVSNIGGSLTPLGDPPLYIGFLRGVEFFWPTRALWQITLMVASIQLALFFAIDSVLMARESAPAEKESSRPLAVRGWLNVALLLGVIVVILASAFWKTDLYLDIAGVAIDAPNAIRVIALLGLAAVSLLFTPTAHREGNNFTWAPIVEVAKLFAGIFITIVPVIAMLRAGPAGAFAPVLALVTNADGSANNAMYFWLTGGLSSFLDNAPTYLVFYNAAGGNAQMLMGPMAATLAAISAGAVFMGANTYIGNAPNFMVKAIAEESGVKMPSFFAYMLWSTTLLLPTFALVTLLYFH